MNWQIGDVAICITPGSRIEGMEVIICSGLEYGAMENVVGAIDECQRYFIYAGVPSKHSKNYWAARPQNLKPLPPPNEVTTWESMEDLWKPKELVGVEV